MKTLAEPQLNATPLIDVLLVLLVMLIFTLPMASHAVKLNLPQRTGAPPSPEVNIHIDFDGQLYWNGESLSLEQMQPRFRAVAAASQAPTVKVIPDKRTRYEQVAQLLAAAQHAGVSNLAVAPIF